MGQMIPVFPVVLEGMKRSTAQQAFRQSILDPQSRVRWTPGPNAEKREREKEEYESVEDYDPVLRWHCRIGENG